MDNKNFKGLSDDSHTDIILKTLNYIHDKKQTGCKNSIIKQLINKIISHVGLLFSRLVSKGLKNTDDINYFESFIPKKYSESLSTVKENNTVALMKFDNWYKRSTPVDTYSNGLKVMHK